MYISTYAYEQIADFGMSRDLTSDYYYITSGGKIPVKWTAPEVSIAITQLLYRLCWLMHLESLLYRLCIIANTQSSVMYGAMVVLCMKYGV